MGECGCRACCDSYRLPISKTACYVIELCSGCEYCSVSPGIIIRRIEKGSVDWEDVQESPEIRLTKVDDGHEAAIKCGLDPDEFCKEASAVIIGTEVDEDSDHKIDDALAEILTEDIWGDVLCRRPKLIEYEERSP